MTNNDHKPLWKNASHLNSVLQTNALALTAKYAVKRLRDIEFDAVAFRGISGALIAPIVALRLKKSMILVRKPEEKTHSSMQVEGDAAARRYVIVDDFVSSGNTVRTIIQDIKKFAPQAYCIGVLEVSIEDRQMRKINDYWILSDIEQDMTNAPPEYIADYKLRLAD